MNVSGSGARRSLGGGEIQFLGADDLRRFDELLGAFVQETQVKCAFLLDRTGRLLTSAGDVKGIDLTSFATLAAADFAASDQLAVLLGEEEFTSLYHAGDASSMFLAGVAGTAVIASMFDGRTTLGLVRLRARPLVSQLETAFQELSTRKEMKQGQLDNSWLAEGVDAIDRLFSDF